jgi:branched-subunit amino acid ABC-type transport system permease component
MLQIVVNSLIRASQLSLVAVGLTMTYDLLGFANFAHVEFLAIGAFLAYLFNVTCELNLIVSSLFAITLAGVVAVASDKLVFNRLRKANSVILMITSLGLGMSLRGGISGIWGAGIRRYGIPLQRPYVFGGLRITQVQIWIIVAALIAMVSFYLLLHNTKLGKAMRATSDNPALAQASGIDTKRVITWVWFMSGALAAFGGILIGMDTQIAPRMGFAIVIPIFAATILGGLGNPYGAMLGAVILGFAESFGLNLDFGKILTLNGLLGDMGQAYIPTGYKVGISFMIMIVVLLVRPSGILGKGR